MKILIPLLIMPLFVAGYIESDQKHVSDFIYLSSHNISEETICSGKYFHEIEKPVRAIKDDVAFIYYYESIESKKSEEAFYRIKDKIGMSNIGRYSGVLSVNDDKSALWGELLKLTGFDRQNPELIMKSYDYFLNKNEENRSEFNRELLAINIVPQKFHDMSKDYFLKEKIEKNIDIMREVDLKSIPAILVKGTYVIYPSFFKDQRDAWMLASVLLKRESKENIGSC